jgi:hypothetical protein
MQTKLLACNSLTHRALFRLQAGAAANGLRALQRVTRVRARSHSDEIKQTDTSLARLA